MMVAVFFIQLLVFIISILSIVLCVWGYKDTIGKGRSRGYALSVCIMILFFPIIGIIVYLCIRNI